MEERQVGFIREKREIKFLILYIASRLIAPAPFEGLQELTMCEPAIDFFAFSECLSSLVTTEHMTVSEDGLYRVTEKGVRNGRYCEEELPYSVRLNCDKTIAEYNKRLKRRMQIKSSYEPQKNGNYLVNLRFNDDHGAPLLDLDIAVPGKERAKDLTGRFQKSPETMYGELLHLFFGEEKKKTSREETETN